MKQTEIDCISAQPGCVFFRVLWRNLDEGAVAFHRVSTSPSSDLGALLDSINAMAPDYPPVGQADTAALTQAFADCPPSPAPTFSEIKDAKRSAIDAAAAARNQEPFEWDFGATEAKDDDGVSVGAAGIQTLQVRGVEDEKNWLAAHAGALTAILGGAPNTVCPIKTTANVWVQTTASQVVTVLAAGSGASLSLLQRQQANLANHGALKKACAQAADQAALDAIDETAGWP